MNAREALAELVAVIDEGGHRISTRTGLVEFVGQVERAVANARAVLAEADKPIRVHRACPAHTHHAITFAATAQSYATVCFVCEQEDAAIAARNP